ncbi:hypothetical protein D3C81_2029160 [compost metagenome]
MRGGLAEQQAGKQSGEEGAVTLGHGQSPDRREVISAIGQSMGRANTPVSTRQTAVSAALFGLTGLNSQVVFRTAMAHRCGSPNPAGARLAGLGE